MGSLYSKLQVSVENLCKLVGMTKGTPKKEIVEIDGIRYSIPDVEGDVCVVNKVLTTDLEEYDFVPSIRWYGREYRITSFKSFCFSGCTSLQRVNVANITDWCSLKFESLNSNPLSSGAVLYVGKQEVVNLEIPDDVKEIGYECFGGCSNIRSVTIPDSVKTIGGGCFQGCSSLKEIILPNTMTSLEAHCFEDCASLESIVVPEGVTKIGLCCFRGCKNLKSITLPKTLTRLCDQCFEGCVSLTSICLPEVFDHIGCNCFNGCENFKELTCYAKEVPDQGNGYNPFAGTSYREDGTLFVPEDSVEEYMDFVDWHRWRNIVPVE